MNESSMGTSKKNNDEAIEKNDQPCIHVSLFGHKS
jgi:hypothetical protein